LLFSLLNWTSYFLENLNAPSLAEYDHFKKTIDLSATAEDHNEVCKPECKQSKEQLIFFDAFSLIYIVL
jgi:hypothetical protein